MSDEGPKGHVLKLEPASFDLRGGAVDFVVRSAEREIDDARARVVDWMRESRRGLHPEPRSKVAIQYTSMATLASMLPHVPDTAIAGPREIWASSAPHMNDTREFSFGKGKVLAALKRLVPKDPDEEKAKSLLLQIAEEARGEEVYCACFSAKQDDLGQWRGYGDDGRGCCVVYDLGGLRRAHRWLSGWVLYDPASQKVAASRLAREFVAALAPFTHSVSDRARRALARLVPSTFVFFKDTTFGEEQEFRLVYAPLPGAKNLPVHFGERRGRIVPYVRLPFEDGAPLRQIWIGPRNDEGRVRSAIEHLKRERGLRGVEVRRSRIPYLP